MQVGKEVLLRVHLRARAETQNLASYSINQYWSLTLTGDRDQGKKGIMIYLNRGDIMSADSTNEQLLEVEGHQGNRGSVLSQHSLR